MISSFLISLALSVPVIIFTGLISGAGLIFENVPVFLTLLLCPVPVLALSGYLKDFWKSIFSTKQTLKNASYNELQNYYESIKLYLSTVLAAGCFVALLSAVALMYNWSNKQFAGPNTHSLLCSLYYTAIFYIILIPLKLRYKYLLISFMDEDGKASHPVNSDKKNFTVNLIKIVISAVLFIALIAIYSLLFLKNEKSIFIPFNIPTILILFLFTCILILASGTFKQLDLFKNTNSESGSEFSLLNKKMVFVSNLQSSIIFSGIFLTLSGVLSILCNLTDKSQLVENTYVAFIAIFYSIACVILLLPIKAALSKRIHSFHKE